jgi:hypothetical protein
MVVFEMLMMLVMAYRRSNPFADFMAAKVSRVKLISWLSIYVNYH